MPGGMHNRKEGKYKIEMDKNNTRTYCTQQLNEDEDVKCSAI
jgi:hypothetical protein